ncbi:MAG: holo-ACP synthase [Cytophagales bacterium]|nr:holo-ACP synthase [Cytophagales bacterium]
MIAGTGIDMVDVVRIAEKLAKENGFREKVFSTHEISFCESKAKQAEHYAGHFAAKEAFLKAIGRGLLLDLDLTTIEVQHETSGKPFLKLTGVFDAFMKEQQYAAVHLSITHTSSMACAMVILEK